jgi:transposase
VRYKSQIQALDRTQPGLPLKKGRGQTMTHDYKRNGTTTLFAALDTASGEVYGLCQQRHRHQEWLRFLRMIDQTVDTDKQVYLICDNYATHKHPRVERWLARHKRFHVRFTPTSASWLNMIERFFRDLTANQIRRGVFQDLEQLITAIGDYIDHHNANPKPFIWTAKASDILEKVKCVAGNSECALDDDLEIAFFVSATDGKDLMLHIPAIKIAVLGQHLERSGIRGELIISIIEVWLPALIQRLHRSDLTRDFIFDEWVYLIEKSGLIGYSLAEYKADRALNVVPLLEAANICLCADCPSGGGFQSCCPEDHAQISPHSWVLMSEHHQLHAVIRHVLG